MNVSNVTIIHDNFFDSAPDLHLKNPSDIAILLTNPPYISNEDYQTLEPEVLAEPKEALVADNNGMKIIDQCIAFAEQYNMILISEIGHNQRQYFNKPSSSYYFIDDLSGNTRIVVCIPLAIQHKFNTEAIIPSLNL